MSKRVLAVLLIALISLFSFTACKSDNKKSGNTNSSQSASADAENNAESDNDESGEAGGKKSGSSSGSKKGVKNDGWEQQEETGTLVKGDIKVNVVEYSSADLKDGEKLLDELIEGGMDEIKEVLSKQKTEDSIIYRVHGKRINVEEPEYVKILFVSQENIGYVVTVLADTESDMDTDISYILSNLKEFVQ